MSQQELVKKVVTFLTEHQIFYMMTGSIVSSLQGEPRLTHDIDVIVQIDRNSIKHFLSGFKSSEYFIEENAIKDAIDGMGMFNIIDIKEGGKVDFWMLTDSPFDLVRFERRRMEQLFDIKVFVSSPEDTILAKLKWAKESGGSEKHFTDAVRIYEVQYDMLDMDHIHQWVHNLDLGELWKELLNSAQI